jgi:hypothetical protein
MSRNLIVLLFILPFVLACFSAPDAIAPEMKSLAGSWQEEYTLGFYTHMVEPPGNEVVFVNAVSRLEADDSLVSVTIFLDSGGSLEVEREFSVKYTLSHDTVFFTGVEGTSSAGLQYMYRFEKGDNRISLCSRPVPAGDGLLRLEMNGFLWGFGMAGCSPAQPKRCGEFRAVD